MKKNILSVLVSAGVSVAFVVYDENGNVEFKKIRWREDKKLTDAVYGFDKAYSKELRSQSDSSSSCDASDHCVSGVILIQ